MIKKENNLTQFFTEYLSKRLGAQVELNTTNITMACYSALNGIDDSLSVAEVVFEMRNDFECIYKVIDNLARDINKNINVYDRTKQRKSATTLELLTIPEIHCIYGISQQAMRKACVEKRISYREGTGKNKYLITKADVEMYVKCSKHKHKETAIS